MYCSLPWFVLQKDVFSNSICYTGYPDNVLSIGKSETTKDTQNINDTSFNIFLNTFYAWARSLKSIVKILSLLPNP